MKKIQVTETVDVVNQYGTYTLPELLEQINRAVQRVPDACQASVKFEVVHDEEWHQYDPNPSHRATLKLSYSRLETDEELAARKAIHTKRNKEDEDRERAEFERLRKKFK